MAGRIPVGRALFMTVGVTGLGYAIMSIATPSDQELYDALAPDLKKKVDMNRAARKIMQEKEEQMRKIKASADSDKPVWSSSLQK